MRPRLWRLIDSRVYSAAGRPGGVVGHPGLQERPARADPAEPVLDGGRVARGVDHEFPAVRSLHLIGRRHRRCTAELSSDAQPGFVQVYHVDRPTACFWAPLRDERDIDDSRRGRALARFRLLLDAYGAPPRLRHEVVRATVAANAWISDIIEEGQRAGHPAFTEVWASWGERYARAEGWLRAHRADLIVASA